MNKKTAYMFQQVMINGKEGYLFCLAPKGESVGSFRQEEGGVVWVTKQNPKGTACETRAITPKEREQLLNQLRERRGHRKEQEG